MNFQPRPFSTMSKYTTTEVISRNDFHYARSRIVQQIDSFLRVLTLSSFQLNRVRPVRHSHPLERDIVRHINKVWFSCESWKPPPSLSKASKQSGFQQAQGQHRGHTGREGTCLDARGSKKPDESWVPCMAEAKSRIAWGVRSSLPTMPSATPTSFTLYSLLRSLI